MPAGPGESLLTTLFGDIHYYFNDPTSKPLHHRFDRGSYVYLYHNAVQQQTKLEVANAAGTADQDAFHGYLNYANVRYSHLQPNLITLVINTSALPDHSTWHLPSFDLTNQQKYLHKIHAIDIYLWTEKDATTLLNHLKSVVGVDRMDIKNAPPTSRTSYASNEHHDSMSPVVQQLEKTAISSQFVPRSGSTISTTSFAGPPTTAAPVPAPPPQVVGYNPAAPAAPEPVTYREPTPPPIDDGTGTGLNTLGKYDTAAPPQYPSTPGFQPQQSSFGPTAAAPSTYFSGPPTTASSSRPGPPSQTPSFGPMATSTISTSPPPQQQQTYSALPAHLQQQTFPSYGTPPPPPPPSAATSPPPPGALPGGYSSYSYATASGQQQTQYSAAETHAQVYRPTEAESSGHGHRGFFKRSHTEGSVGSSGSGGPGGPGGGKKDPKNRLNEGIQGLDSKVTGLLGRLDKMF